MLSFLVRVLFLLRLSAYVLCAVAFFPGQAHASTTAVASGSTIYNSNVLTGYGACSSCHYYQAAPSTSQGVTAPGHSLAANNPGFILTAMSPGGCMYESGSCGGASGAGFGAQTLPTLVQRFHLSMYIGQYKAPIPGNGTLNINTSTGNTGTIDVYPLLPTNGSSGVAQDSGGLTSVNGTHGSTSASAVDSGNTVRYDITYTRTDSFVGQDTFTYKIINPAASSGVQATVTVNLIGITSAASQNGTAGQAFNYAITTNGSVTGNYGYSGTLPGGMAFDASTGVFSGPLDSSAAGTYNINVSAATSVGTVSKAVTFTIAGFTSASTLSLTQGATTNLPFTLGVFPNAAITLFSGALPNGVTYDSANKQLVTTTGPVAAGSFPVVFHSGSLTQTLTITVAQASAPIITTDLAENNPTVLGTVGTPITPFHIFATHPELVTSYIVSGVSGLVVDQTTGVVSGTPSANGNFTLSLNASNGATGTAKTISVRVNSNLAPVINSLGTANGTVGTNATQYTISTSGANGPLTSTPYGATGLPPGLTVDATSGAISGSPTTSGTYTATVSATNTGNLTGTKSVVFTINPNAVSSITSPANGATTVFAVNTAASVQLVASNSPTSFAVTPALPTGFSLNTVTGLITVLPTAPMSSTPFTFTATNLIGTSTPITLNFSVGSPAPTSCAITTSLNTALTVDLATCIFNGASPSGMRVSLAPGHGNASVSGTSLTYTPAQDFFGADSLMVVGLFGSLQSQPATVTITITGRPDPAQNAAVTGLVANQSQTALRFSQAQVTNFGRHMENLRQPGGSGRLRSTVGGLTVAGAQALNNPGSDGAWNTASTTNASFGATALHSAAPMNMPATGTWGLQGTSATQLPAGTNPTATLPVDAGVMMAMTQMGVPNAQLIGLLYNFNQNHSLDLGVLKQAFGSDGQSGSSLPGTSVWVEGVVSFGSRDANGGTDAAQYSSNGISVGVDMPVSEAFTWGMGLGLARDVAYIGTDGSRNQSQGYSLAAYGSYLFGDNAFVEGMLGVGTIDYEMRRWVTPAADYARSNRKGLQIFGSIGTGLEYRTNGRMISPYLRLDFSQDKLDEVTETGAGNFALHYFDQTNNSSQAVLGLRGEAVHSTRFGWAVPRARVEWRQDLADAGDSVISYADQIGGTRYSIAPTDSRRSALVLGLGSEFLFRDGWSFGLDYQLSRVSSSESSYALRLRLTKELGAKGLRKLLREDEEATDDENEITVDTSATWDDNITRAKVDSDIRADMVYTVNVSRTLEYRLNGNTRFLLTGVATGERLQTFNGLSRAALGAEAALQYRGSAAFDAPTWGLLGKVTGEDFVSTLRDGTRTALGVTWLQPLTDRITLFSALTANMRKTNSTVFDTEDTSLRLNVDYALGKGATLYLTGEYRDGDIVSTGRRSLENITIALARIQDDAFPDGDLFSYRLKGTTTLFTLGYNVGLGARDSLDFSWRFVQSTPSLRPAWATSPSSYISNQLSATYLMRF